jgi:hypothetical protein
MEDHTNQELFYRVWEQKQWANVTRHTDDAVADENVRASVAGDGEIFLMWQRNGELVLDRNLSGDPRMAREASDTVGFADYAMTFGPAGNLVVIWQEMSETGPDAHYTVYDPLSETWSRDARFFNDEHLERSFATVWDDAGNLTMAYSKVQIVTANKTVTLEDGTELEIENVPQPGRVDLEIMKRALIKDLALNAGDFIVNGGNFLPGDAVTLSATARNLGDVAANNVTVSVGERGRNGFDCLAGVVAGGNGRRDAGDCAGAELGCAFRDELGVGNSPGGPERDGDWPRAGHGGRADARAGRLAHVALDLPAGTQPEGESFYQLKADETGVTGDVSPGNNTITFALNLWLDSDGDGMPDSWELAHGLDPNNPDDAGIDTDGDGLSNLAEYLAGTDPNDPGSYLRIESIGVDEADGIVSGIQLTWGSQPNRLYTVERAGELGAGFLPLARHILAAPPENIYHDASATNSGPYFFRIKVK